MRAGVAYPDRADPTVPPDLTGALCVGHSAFTADGLHRIIANILIDTCHRCPVLEACAADRDRWRTAHPFDWAQFSGVWAGQAFAKGRPAVGSGNRR